MYLPVYHPKTCIYGKKYNPSAQEKKWEELCRVLSKCSNLLNLHIKIFDGGFCSPDDKLLRPLKSIVVENFTVQLPWNLDHERAWEIIERGTYPRHAMYEDKDVKFHLLRPGPETLMVLEETPSREKRRGRRSCLEIVVFTPILICVLLAEEGIGIVNSCQRKASSWAKHFGPNRNQSLFC